MSEFCFDMMKTYPPSIAAAKKMKAMPENFAFYKFAWMGDYLETDIMEVTGCVFREAKSGKHKGQRSVIVKGTRRTVYITSAEMKRADKKIRSKGE